MYYLAVDIGASSGRHILGSIQNGKIVLEEVYRFENKNVKRNGHLCWELDRLFAEIKNGMRECARLGKKPVSMGIDCFAVDFVLLDGEDKIIGDTIAYRDSRTEGMPQKVNEIIPDLYKKTGIAQNVFNTIYQLCTVKEELKQAKRLLMIPEYFNFLLTGEKINEYTNASTTGLLNAQTRDYDKDILDALDIPEHIFETPRMPGTVVGKLLPEIAEETGLDLTVVLPATHDTASAVMSVPGPDNVAYISSGTWSLMGTLLESPVCTEQGQAAGFTCEGAYDGKIRYLKNIMGLWIIQSLRREQKNPPTFPEMIELAERSVYEGSIDVNAPDFLAPESMTEAIYSYLERTKQPSPDRLRDILRCVYISLAKSYAQTVSDMEKICGKSFDAIYIVGGGCRDNLLNRMTAEYSGKKVYAGPVEATALGNILIQMTKDKVFESMADAKKCITESFEIGEF